MSRPTKKQLDKITTVRIGADIEIKQEQDYVILTKESILELAEIIKREGKQMNRPYTSLRTFEREKEICQKAIKSLRKHYITYAKRKGGIVSNYDIDKKIFPKVLEEIKPKNLTEKNVVESLFDSFLGAFVMFQNSEIAFKMLEAQVSGKLEDVMDLF